jgi:orotidine-5'-phosphate decarboxylase
VTREPRVIVALDYAGAAAALRLVDRLDPTQCRLKVGKELFTAAGPAFVESLVARGYGVFLDLKYHDIPNTVAAACRAAATLGVWMLNVHALGGIDMMRAAREALAGGPARPRLIAVTVLTSMADADLVRLGIAARVPELVVSLARLAQDCGLDGAVASAQEAAVLRSRCGAGFLLVTPGIRPAQAASDDQQRVTTPAAAVTAGADFLVVGRPVTRAPDPLAALRAINDEIAAALKGQG